MEYALNEWKQIWKMSTCDRLDYGSLASWPTLYAQKLPGHWCERKAFLERVNEWKKKTMILERWHCVIMNALLYQAWRSQYTSNQWYTRKFCEVYVRNLRKSLRDSQGLGWWSYCQHQGLSRFKVSGINTCTHTTTNISYYSVGG